MFTIHKSQSINAAKRAEKSREGSMTTIVIVPAKFATV